MDIFVSLLESCYVRYEREFELWSRVRSRFFGFWVEDFRFRVLFYQTIIRQSLGNLGPSFWGCFKGSCSCLPPYRADGTCLQQKGPCIKIADPRHVECSL